MGYYEEPFLKYLLGNFKDGIIKTSTFESEDQSLITTASCMADLYRQISVLEDTQEYFDNDLYFLVILV
jgi:hypothetical protein